MFSRLWPGFDHDEVPISSVTNGVHGPTWVARELSTLLGREWGLDVGEGPLRDGVSDAQLWGLRRELREKLVHEVRRRVRAAWLQRGASPAGAGLGGPVFDPDVLTVGFARRVPTYKRLTLMLRDPDRLRDAAAARSRPIQVVVAGKSHPADENGKQLIQQIVRFVDGADVRHRIVFLPDYDMSMARYLYRGCDVWLNNPVRPLEACGTSGMKSALNGGLNLSIRDGWWDECYDGSNGWAIPTADGVADPLRRDDLEAAALYELLGQQIAPLFYDRSADGVPDAAGCRWCGTRWRRWARGSRRPGWSASTWTTATCRPSRMVAAATGDGYRGRAVAGGLPHEGSRCRGRGCGSSTRSCWWRRPSRLVVGTEVTIRARIDLAGLDPSEVDIQAVVGRVGDDDELRDAVTVPMIRRRRRGVRGPR